MKKKKVLIIEDDLVIQGLYKDNLPNVVRDIVKELFPEDLPDNFDCIEIVQAFSFRQAERKFATEKDITHILIDDQLGIVEHEGPNTINLLIEMRKAFNGPIIATSCDEINNIFLMNNGCNNSMYKGEALMDFAYLLVEEILSDVSSLLALSAKHNAKK